MNLLFFVSTLTMILVAMSFAATPLVASYRKNNAGFAKFPLLAIIVVLGFAVALYAAIGRPGLGSQTPVVETAGAPAILPQVTRPGEKAASIETLLSGLEERLRSDPDDGKDWLLLAQSYEHVGRNADASDAYARAVALGVSDAALGARLGNDESMPAVATAEK